MVTDIQWHTQLFQFINCIATLDDLAGLDYLHTFHFTWLKLYVGPDIIIVYG